jgi:hypothetical protein
MSKNRKLDNKMAKTSYPLIKVDLAVRDYSIHLGPFMPFNSGGFVTPIETAYFGPSQPASRSRSDTISE